MQVSRPEAIRWLAGFAALAGSLGYIHYEQDLTRKEVRKADAAAEEASSDAADAESAAEDAKDAADDAKSSADDAKDAAESLQR